MIRSGVRVVLKELARRPDLNGAHGIAVSRRKGDRWAVQLGGVPHPVVDGFGNCSALDVGALQRRLRDAPLFARCDGHNRAEPAPQQLSSAITSRCCAI